jgi:hypothetical protein
MFKNRFEYNEINLDHSGFQVKAEIAPIKPNMKPKK